MSSQNGLNQNLIGRIRSNLTDRPRDLLLFDLALQTGLKMIELLRLKVRDLKDLKAGGDLPFAGQLASDRYIPLIHVETVQVSFLKYMEILSPQPDDYLFKSRKGSKPLTLSTASRMVRSWFEAAGHTGPSGIRALRSFHNTNIKSVAEVKMPAPKQPDALEPLQPVRSNTIRERVYQDLMSSIVTGRIPPGQSLIASEIAERMRVSQMPVREALVRLETTGFLDSTKRKGSVVRALNKKNLEEIKKIRMTLEAMAIEAAAARQSKKFISQLEIIHHSYTESFSPKKPDESLRLNTEFHFSIYRHSKMPMLVQLIESVWARFSPYLYIYARVIETGGLKTAIPIHQGMLDGLKTGNSTMAVEWLQKDIETSTRHLMDMFNQQNDPLALGH